MAKVLCWIAGMPKRWKWVAGISILVILCLLVGLSVFNNSVPRLSRREKNLVKAEFIATQYGGDIETYKKNAIIWYDENWHVEKNRVWRYIGTYGDCYAFLAFYDGMLNPLPGPYELRGLSRSVLYPNKAYVFLYHTKEAQVTAFGRTVRLAEIPIPEEYRKKWITDEQWKQLTRDIVEIAREYN